MAEEEMTGEETGLSGDDRRKDNLREYKHSGDDRRGDQALT